MAEATPRTEPLYWSALAIPSPEERARFRRANAYARLRRYAEAVADYSRAIEQGDPSAAAQLLPLVYDELRRLAAEKMARERPGQTLQATALVQEAYLRLVASPGCEAGEGNSRL